MLLHKSRAIKSSNPFQTNGREPRGSLLAHADSLPQAWIGGKSEREEIVWHASYPYPHPLSLCFVCVPLAAHCERLRPRSLINFAYPCHQPWISSFVPARATRPSNVLGMFFNIVCVVRLGEQRKRAALPRRQRGRTRDHPLPARAAYLAELGQHGWMLRSYGLHSRQQARECPTARREKRR